MKPVCNKRVIKMKNMVCAAMLGWSSLACAENLYAHYQSQAESVYTAMSLDEKIGQLLLPSYLFLANSVSPKGQTCQAAMTEVPRAPVAKIIHECGLDQLKKYHLGAVLTGGGPYFNAPTLQNWAELNSWAMAQHDSTHDPLLFIGNDAVHGNMHVQGAVIFPHNIGLGVTHDPELIQQIAETVGQDSLASGFNWVYAPTVAIAQDLRWGRTYESFAMDPMLVKQFSQAYINGLQSIQADHITGALATVKHFVGDGATHDGFDEGDDQSSLDDQQFWQANGAGYEGAVQANVGSLMVSYNAIEGDTTRMHLGGKWDLLNQFKRTSCPNAALPGLCGFAGFAVSDWNGTTRAAYFYAKATQKVLSLEDMMAMSINGGVDMLMLGQDEFSHPFDIHSPANYTTLAPVVEAIKSAVLHHAISEERLHEAVTRILKVKFAMLSKEPADYAALQTRERELALQAAQESLVLLQNDHHLLPLNAQTIKNVIFIGDTNDLGLQNGGWAVNWQGQKGSEYFTGADKISSGAMTLEEAVRARLGDAVHYYHRADLNNTLTFDHTDTLVISVLAENPYAEFMGDINSTSVKDAWYDLGAAQNYNLYLGSPQLRSLELNFKTEDLNALTLLQTKGIPSVTVIYSGRPMIITQALQTSDAVIAAFLPGTLGGAAVSHALLGDYHFRTQPQSNVLTFPWPRTMQDVEEHFTNYQYLYPVGYGLSD